MLEILSGLYGVPLIIISLLLYVDNASVYAVVELLPVPLWITALTINPESWINGNFPVDPGSTVTC